MVRQPQGGLGRSVLTKQVTPLCRDPPPITFPGSLWCVSRKADWGAVY